jgi:hypothetical protein
MPSEEAKIFEGKICRIVPRAAIHYGSILQIDGQPVECRLLKWLDHGVLIAGDIFIPWSNITTITPMEE